MNPRGQLPLAAHNSNAGDWIVFTLAGERLAVAMELVESIAAPPPLAAIPHAPPALLGAGNLGGRILPIVDLARLLGRARTQATYDGSGDIVRLRVGGDDVGIWVERVERPMRGDVPDRLGGDGITLIDVARLFAGGIVPPAVASGPPVPLGDVDKLAAPSVVGPAAEPFVVVEVPGRPVQLRQDQVLELLDGVPWTPVPGAPVGFYGVGLLRGSAVPILSLSALLGLPVDDVPGGFVATAVGGRRLLLAVARLVGLRTVAEHRSIDPDALISDELRRIVLGFPALEDAGRSRATAISDHILPYLSFAVAGQDCAVPIAQVDRIVAAQPWLPLPQPATGDGRIPLDGAIELRGQIVPVASLQSRLGRADDGKATTWAPRAYVILRDGHGLGAVAVDQVKQVVGLRPETIAPPPSDDAGPIAGIVAQPDGGLLRIIASELLWNR